MRVRESRKLVRIVPVATRGAVDACTLLGYESVMKSRRVFGASLLLLLAGVACPAADKADRWIEVRSPHFTVMSNASEKQARHSAAQFEQFRAVFRAAMPNARTDSGTPLVILAARDEKTLKELLPEFWEKKGRARPAGCFVRGLGKNFVALRLDAPGDLPYHVIYHEYTHNLLILNYGAVPLWLSEGMAEFFAHAQIGEANAGIGRPSPRQLRLLRTARLMPLETLFGLDFDSPQYNETDKTSLFYAQSWALTHYLMMSEDGANREKLMEFLRLLQDDVPVEQAAPRALGDLQALGKQLAAYVHGETFFTWKVAPEATPDERTFAVRELPYAESLAVRGDFHLHNERRTEARILIEDALRLNPALAMAHESLGFLHLRNGDHEAAEKSFAEAVRLDSGNALAHYYHALALAREGELVGDLDATEKHLCRAIELNPDFAPAYAMLAYAFSAQGTRLDEALRLARRAAGLEPGAVRFQLTVAGVLLRMERLQEAMRLGQRALDSAKKQEDRTAAQDFLDTARKYQRDLAAKRKYEEQLAAEQKALEERRLQREPPKVSGGAVSVMPRLSRGVAAPPAGENVSVEGIIAVVLCTEPTALDLHLEHSGVTTKLHTGNYLKVEYYALDWQPPEDFQPCRHLEGLRAKVTYRATPGQAYAGEILTIEVRK